MRLLPAASIIAATAAAVAAIGLASPASAEVRTFNLSGFRKIEASAAFPIEFTQSPTWSVVIDSRHDNLQHIIVEKVGDTLRITRPKNTNLQRKVEDIVRISAPDLDMLKLDSAIRFDATTLDVDNLIIDTEAAVEIDITRLKARNVTIDADAGSKIALAGSCTKLDIVLGAALQVKTEGLKCRETHIDAGTASSVHAFASDKAVANAGMASKVLISGNPRDFKETHDKFGSRVSLAD